MAWVRLSGALRAFQAFEMYAEMLGCLEDMADLLHVRGMPDDAACLYAAVERLREGLALSRPPRFEVRTKDRIGMLRRALGDASFDAAWAKARSWGIEQTIRRALSSPPMREAAAA